MQVIIDGEWQAFRNGLEVAKCQGGGVVVRSTDGKAPIRYLTDTEWTMWQQRLAGGEDVASLFAA